MYTGHVDYYEDFIENGAEVTGLMQERVDRGFDTYRSDLDDLDRWQTDDGPHYESNALTGDNL